MMRHRNDIMRNQQLRRQTELSQLETAYLERNKRNAREADRIVELKQEVKKLEPETSGLKAVLKNEEPKLKKHCSFRNLLRCLFCLKTKSPGCFFLLTNLKDDFVFFFSSVS